MSMAATKVWTLQELGALPEDGNVYELIHGELFVTPAPSYDHETIAARLSAVLTPYVIADGLGLVYRPQAVIQTRESQVEPDLMVCAVALRGTQWIDAPLPILVVEVLSPSTHRLDRERKRSLYRELGVADYWIIDPDSRTVTWIRAGRDDVTERVHLTWHPRGASAPLEIGIATLFH